MSNSSDCVAVVFGCIDYRIHDFVLENVKKILQGAKFDYVGVAGCAKDKKVILKELEISHRLHNVRKAILVNHEDCGAYGPEGTFEKHKADLDELQYIIKKKFPLVEVSKYYQKLNGSFLAIE